MEGQPSELFARTILFALIHSSYGIVTNYLTDNCLGCICEATSDCNKTLGCLGDICGPYWITKPYWEDANKPTIPLDEPHSRGAFERCVFDPVCAGETIRNYMNRYGQDCNGDGMITCLDYASIHRLGAYGCFGSLDPRFKTKFDPCLRDIGEATNNIERNAHDQEGEIFGSDWP